MADDPRNDKRGPPSPYRGENASPRRVQPQKKSRDSDTHGDDDDALPLGPLEVPRLPRAKSPPKGKDDDPESSDIIDNWEAILGVIEGYKARIVDEDDA